MTLSKEDEEFFSTWAVGKPDVVATETHPNLWRDPGDPVRILRSKDRHPWIEMLDGTYVHWQAMDSEAVHAAFTTSKAHWMEMKGIRE